MAALAVRVWRRRPGAPLYRLASCGSLFSPATPPLPPCVPSVSAPPLTLTHPASPMNQAPLLAVQEWPEEWTARPMIAAEDHVAHPGHATAYGLTYGGPSEPSCAFEEWDRDGSGMLAMEYMPSYVDGYGFKRVLPENLNTNEVSSETPNQSSSFLLSGVQAFSHAAHLHNHAGMMGEVSDWSCGSAFPMMSGAEHEQAAAFAMLPHALPQGASTTTPSIGPLHAALLAQIGQLDLTLRQQVAQLVDQLQPGIVVKNAGEWSFSISQLSDATVAQIYHALASERATPESAWSVPSDLIDADVALRRRHSSSSSFHGADDHMEAFLPTAKRFKMMEDISEESSLSEESLSEYTTSLDDGSMTSPMDDMSSSDGLHSAHHGHSHGPHPCHVCKKSFPTSTGLNKHLKTHNDERQFACTHPGCTKRFSHSSTLKDHMNIHLQRKPYTCKECGKGFPNGSNLNRHARIHTKSKPYVCNVCNKAFSQSSNLRVHQKIHERPSKSD